MPTTETASASRKIELRNVSVRYGSQPTELALEELNFTVDEREFLCILGPSGCGKSTMLHLLAGFMRPSGGEILANGAPIEGPDRNRGIVFQRHALFPWKTVAGNVEFGLRARGAPEGQRTKISMQYLAEMGLADFKGHYPFQLSVGMRQRVALARAFANDPDILLMDEPFASLDAQTRLKMQELLLSIWSQHQKTVVFVTHDIDEAILLADRILLLAARPGKVSREIRVNAPRPRNLAMLTSDESVRIKREALAALQT